MVGLHCASVNQEVREEVRQRREDGERWSELENSG